MRYAVILSLLCACEDRETARARNESRLPEGCKIIDMDYGDLTVAVVCEGRKTSSLVKGWDETTMVCQPQANGSCMMMPQVTHHTSTTAEIGLRQ